MNSPKAITDLIDPPRINDVEPLEDISEDSLELRGIASAQQTFEPGKYTYIDFSDTTFLDLAANNVSTYRSTIVRTTFKKSQLTGIHLPEGNFKDVVFENCRLNLVNFRNSVFERCLFINCDLTEADFGASRFSFVLFEGCQFVGTDFSKAKHTKTEIKNTSLSKINGINGLTGVSISGQNLIEIAPLLAHELGIIITD